MTGSQWIHARKLAEHAIQLDPAAENRFLQDACRDAGLRAAVAAFLDGDDVAEAFLEPVMTTTADALCAHFAESAMIGTTIGAYRLIELIAAGGMGSVYRAVRADAAYEKVVAIKIVSAPLATTPLADRFDYERRTLAALEHPGITRLLDGGTTPDGRPYLVMEYVEGQRIDVFCDDHRLRIRDRLRLFLDVCEAIHYAHQNLVIHRDLKPANILITADGRPKIVDFGIARPLPSAATDTSTVTATGLRALTPRYASPEQMRGLPMTTATDVYSLGVVLYELLTGRCPYTLDSAAGYDRARAICEQEPTLPSLAVTRNPVDVAGDNTQTAAHIAALRADQPRLLRRRLAGDLDGIVMMALQKDSADRYATVREFADDIERHLDGRPVCARRQTLAYRGTKLIRRNRLLTAAAALGLLALVGGSIGTSVGLIRARRAERLATAQRNTALRAQAEAESVADFLRDVFAAANPYREGRAATVAELLDDAARRVDLELAGQPRVEAGVRYAIAQTYAGLWWWDRARAHARRAVTLFRRTHGDNHPRVADSLSLLGRAETFARNPESIAMQREALAIRRRAFGEAHPLVAESLGNLGFALWHGTASPRWAEAERCYQEAIAVYERVAPDDLDDRARFSFSVGVMYSVINRLEEAERYFEEAMRLFLAMPRREDRYLVECMKHYAWLYHGTGRHTEAQTLLHEALQLIPAETSHNERLATLWRLAQVQQVGGAADEALQTVRRIITAVCQRWSAEYRGTPNEFNACTEVIPSAATLADMVPVVESAFRTRINVDDVYDSHVVQHLSAFGEMLAQAGRTTSARDVYRLALDYGRRHAPRDDYLLAVLRTEYARHALIEHDPARAEEMLLASFDTLRRTRSLRHFETRRAADGLIRMYRATGRMDEAARFARLVGEPVSDPPQVEPTAAP